MWTTSRESGNNGIDDDASPASSPIAATIFALMIPRSVMPHRPLNTLYSLRVAVLSMVEQMCVHSLRLARRMWDEDTIIPLGRSAIAIIVDKG